MSKVLNKKTILLVVWLTLLVGLIVAIPLLGRVIPPSPGASTQPQPAPKLDTATLASEWPQIVAHAAAPALGHANTPYTIAEFGDFECPQCGKSRPLLEQMMTNFPKQVNLLFIHRPFEFHKWAIPAAQASEIAAAHGKFWPMYDLLYSQQDNLESYYYSDYASQIGLERTEFEQAFTAHQGLANVTADAAFSDKIGIQETPTILLHNNTKGTITLYVGLDGTKNKDGSPQYPGVKQLLANPPWAPSHS